MEQEQITLRPARIGAALGRGFRGAYEHLGFVVVASFVSFLVVSAGLSLGMTLARTAGVGGVGQFVFVLPALVLGWLCAVGVFYYAYRSVFHGRVQISDAWCGIRKLLGPALALFAIDLLITAVILGDFAFFRSTLAGVANQLAGLEKLKAASGLSAAQEAQLHSLGRTHILLLAVTIVFGYLSAAWGAIAMYHLPLLAAQSEMESGPRPGVVLRKSVLLAGGSPGFTVVVFLVIIAFAALCALPKLIGVAILFLGAAAFLITHALRELFIRYGVIEEEPEVIEDKPWRLPDSWLKRDNTRQ